MAMVIIMAAKEEVRYRVRGRGQMFGSNKDRTFTLEIAVCVQGSLANLDPVSSYKMTHQRTVALYPV